VVVLIAHTPVDETMLRAYIYIPSSDDCWMSLASSWTFACHAIWPTCGSGLACSNAKRPGEPFQFQIETDGRMAVDRIRHTGGDNVQAARGRYLQQDACRHAHTSLTVPMCVCMCVCLAESRRRP